MRRVITTHDAPAAIGPYSQAIKAGGFVFVSGQLPIDPHTGGIVDQDVKGQTKRALANLEAVLAASGVVLRDVVKTSVFLADMNDFSDMNSVYAEFFTEQPPARVAVEVARLPRDARVEIEAVAYLGEALGGRE